jgi:hypothetical protein
MRDGTSKLAHDRPEADGPQPVAQVLQFRPRQRAGERPPHSLGGSAPRTGESADPETGLPDDLAQYEQDREEDENIDYAQRMLMNFIAVAVVTMLIGVGVWLADTIADMQREQDCILQGRQNCAPIVVPAPVRN